MLRSIRWRLLLWYAGMLLVVIAGFASLLYWSTERSALKQLDARLEGSVRYLEASLRSFPLRELLRQTPFSRPPDFVSPGMPPDGRFRDGPPRDFEKRPPDKRPPDSRPFDQEKRPFDEGRQEGRPRSEGERRQPPPNMVRDAERSKRELNLRPAADADDPKPPLFFTIYRDDGAIFKSVDDAAATRDPALLDSRLGDSIDPLYFESASSRLVICRGPERSIILVGVSMTQERERLHTLLYQLLGSGLLALVLGLLGSWYISGRMMLPLKAISATASNLSATHLAERIDTKQIDAELVEMATVLNDTFARLEAAFQRQSRFTADAGHELRTPLAVLHTNLELALSRPRKEEEFREIIEYCLQSSSKMRSLIDALLMLARADAGQLQANFTQIDLRDVVESAIAHHHTKAKEIKLSAELPDQPVIIHGDATLLGMILSNLILNALRHSQGAKHVTVAVTTDAKEAQLSVADDGVGIPLEAQPHLFERFYRVDESRNRQTGGYGLGLAICKSLTEAHHGTVRCESTPNQGAKFTITLPLASS